MFRNKAAMARGLRLFGFVGGLAALASLAPPQMVVASLASLWRMLRCTAASVAENTNVEGMWSPMRIRCTDNGRTLVVRVVRVLGADYT